MPFQQISLDQSIYNKPKKSPISQALRPQGGKQYKGPIVNPSQGWTGLPGFSDEAKAIYEQNSFVDKQKEEWAAQDKATKQQREQQSSQLQNIGMQTVQQQQQQKQQVQQQQAQVKQQIESNPEPAADEMWKFYLSLPEENQPMFLDQISKQTSSGSTVSSGGRTVQVGGAKYNPIFNNWIEKGYVMFDPKGNIVVNKPEATYEKGTFTEMKNGDILNTSTNEVIVRAGDIPEGINPTQILDVIKEARAYTTGLVDPSMIEGLTPEGRSTFFDRADKKFKEHVSWILQNTYNMTLEQATKIANNMPKEDTIGAPTGGEKGDTTMAYNIYDSIKGKEVSQEEKNYYITTYGQETWDIVERKLKEESGTKKPSPITPTKQPTMVPTTPEPTVYSKGVLGKAGAALNKIFQPK